MPFDTPLFVLVHVVLSLVGIVSGLVVVGGLMAGVHDRRWSGLFLATTALTVLTGFGFPFTRLLPSHGVAAVSVPVLAGAALALYVRRLQGRWRPAFVVLSTLALYLNVFVLLAQLFQKIPAMAQLAPHPAAPAFAITQTLVLALFVGMGWAATRGFGAARVAGG